MKKVLLLICLLASLVNLKANNVQVSNVTLTGQNVANQFTLVQFDISWENSWRLSVGPSNYDAAWVFIKYRRNSGPWQHGTINYVNGNSGSDGHTAPAGSTIATTSDGVGCFIHRSADGSGDVLYANTQLRWNYGADGVQANDILDVQVYAIEMVYVPQSNFYLGATSVGDERNNFHVNTGTFGFETAYLVDSEDAITISSTIGELYYHNNGGSPGDQLGPIPADFPKGFNAFYSMKYEVTEDQWICFFNSLTESQKLNNDITDATHKGSDAEISRNTIAYTSGNATTSAPSRALNYCRWSEVAAYLDWSGLRPMSEMEYEKACRGPLFAVVNEMAWGNANVHGAEYTIVNDGTDAAMVSDPGIGIGNMNYTNSDPGGPMRVGIFAASAINKNREETGATYYGIMEMSGNLYERLMSVGSPESRAFNGAHGNGELTVAGEANVTGWQAIGTGTFAYRGGSYINQVDFARVADRYDGGSGSDIGNGRIGFRGVRTAE